MKATWMGWHAVSASAFLYQFHLLFTTFPNVNPAFFSFFLTIWCQGLSLLYCLLSLIADLAAPVETTKRRNLFFNTYFHVLFAMSIIVCGGFWLLWMVDPSLLMRSPVAIPPLLNHLQHTFPIFFVLGDRYFLYHNEGNFWAQFISCLGVGGCYIAMVGKQMMDDEGGFVPYPMLETFDTPLLFAGFAAASLLVLLGLLSFTRSYCVAYESGFAYRGVASKSQ
tara:strand:- start:513 stop:1181 length:669 start_codon:yes stop_codon:yes gene_type:complete